MPEMLEKLDNVEDKLRIRYSRLTKILIVFVMLFIIWVLIVTLGIAVLEMSPNWAFLTLDGWLYVWSVVIVVFIVLELVFYFHYKSVGKTSVEFEEAKPEFVHGKRLYVYSHPKGVEGGIYSKTYITIDENSVLRLRTLMIPPVELWIKKD